MTDLIQDLAIIALAASVILITLKDQKASRRGGGSMPSQLYSLHSDLAEYVRKQLITKADRSVYVKVGTAWAVVDSDHPIFYGDGTQENTYTLGSKDERCEFVGSGVLEAIELAQKWDGSIVEANNGDLAD